MPEGEPPGWVPALEVLCTRSIPHSLFLYLCVPSLSTSTECSHFSGVPWSAQEPARPPLLAANMEVVSIVPIKAMFTAPVSYLVALDYKAGPFFFLHLLLLGTVCTFILTCLSYFLSRMDLNTSPKHPLYTTQQGDYLNFKL